MLFTISGRTTKDALMSVTKRLMDDYMINHDVMDDHEKIVLLENIVDLKNILDKMGN